MKRITINRKLFELYPEMSIAVIKLNNLKNDSADTENILRSAEKYVMAHYKLPILDLPEIKSWRETYKQLGVKKGSRVSSESLLKRVLKGNNLPLINPLVDIYNAISLKYVFPCGGEDLDATKGNIELTFASGHESFKTIGSEINEPPVLGEVVYKDDLGCLCRCWNWREADRTKLTHETNNAILVIESLTKDRISTLKKAVQELKILSENHLQASVTFTILNKDNTHWNL